MRTTLEAFELVKREGDEEDVRNYWMTLKKQ
jgi:hypothetical protein